MMSTVCISLKCQKIIHLLLNNNNINNSNNNIINKTYLDNGSYMPKSSKEPVVLPTAPRAARGPGFEDENIPHNPPYVAYISNLPYDVVDEDLEELFQDMMVIILIFILYLHLIIN